MKRICALFAALFLTLSLAQPAWGTGEGGLEITAKSCLLMERETGAILYEENAHAPLEPASVTKIMTLLLAAEALEAGTITLEDVVTVSPQAAGMGGSQVYLEEGEEMTVHDLLKAVAVASGNDAAVALAEHLRGSEEAFVAAMNRRAEELGMEDTLFLNCTGLPEAGHLSSAYDIALMSRALLGHDLIRDYTGIWMDSLRGGEFQLANTNKLIRTYPGATGLKTGSTNGAGYCLSASALREDMELIAVVLGAETSKERFEDAQRLLNYGFGAWTISDQTPEGLLPTIPVTLSERETIQPVVEGEIRLLVRKEEAGQLRTELALEETLEAPVGRGDLVGELYIYKGEEQVGVWPVLSGQEARRLSFGEIFLWLAGSLVPG